jgi:cytochrome c biogenesis protein CcmG/thiol:disulfide interchange protein DsbE
MSATFRSRRSPVIACVLLLIVSTIALRGTSAAVTAARSRKTAPDFTLADASGRSIRLSALKGKVVLLDFWATWCTGCKVEIPWYMEFQQKYASRGLAPMGVAMDDEGWPVVKPYLAQHPITYPIVLGDLHLLQRVFSLDPALPVTLLIDRKGRIASTHAGLVDKDAFEHELQQLLRE